MIKIGFIGTVSKEWMGGLNYFKNLLYALDSINSTELKIFFFTGTKTDPDLKMLFNKHATVIEDSIFDRMSFMWLLMKIEQKIFKSNFILEKTLKKYDIQILSHSFLTDFKNIKTINWIPDFQHIHLPEMFSKKEIEQRNTSFMKVVKNSDLLIVSSADALKDFESFAPDHTQKVRVLKFVSQPDYKYLAMNQDDIDELKSKYQISNEFFYMPNQYWKHKNHMIVLEAINELKKEDFDINLICSGHLSDYRNKSHIEDIKNYILINDLNSNIKLLGLIDYSDVFGLIQMSKGVINPSLFEGWSSTVEECKSINKNMILSDLRVHEEQYPSATFFDKHDVESLKVVLKNFKKSESKLDLDLLKNRTKQFALSYIEISKELVQN